MKAARQYKSYAERLRDPRWQKRRLERFNSEGWQCQECGSKTDTLEIHHLRYLRAKDPWDYDDADLYVVCTDCHNAIQSAQDRMMEAIAASISCTNTAVETFGIISGYMRAGLGPFGRTDYVIPGESEGAKLSGLAASAASYSEERNQ